MTISTIINLMIIKNRVNDHYNIDVHLHYHFFDDAPNTHNFGHHSFFLLIPQRTISHGARICSLGGQDVKLVEALGGERPRSETAQRLVYTAGSVGGAL